MPGLGHKSYLQISKESVYGTYAASKAKMEIMACTINPVIGTIRDGSLYSSPSRRGIFQGGILYRGTVTVRLNFEGFLPLFEGVFGSYTGAVVGGETFVRDHTFKEASTLPSYSIEICQGDVLATGKVIRYLGCKIPRMTIRGTAGQGDDGMLTAEFEILAKDMDTNSGAGYTPSTTVTVANMSGSSGSPVITTSADFIAAGFKPGMALSGTNVGAGAVVQSITSATSLTASVNNSGIPTGVLTATLAFPAVLPVLFHSENVNFTTDDGIASNTTIRVRSLEVTLENALADDRFYFGSTTLDEPIRNDFLVARWVLTQEFQDYAALTAARAFTTTSPLFKLSASTTIGGTSKREFEIHSNSAKYTDMGQPIDDYGIIVQRTTQEAFFDGTDASALLVRFRSLDGGQI